MTRPLCFIDTETTSLRPDRAVWEVGMIRVEPGREHVERALLVDLYDEEIAAADPQSLQIGGFYDRHPTGRWMAGGATQRPGDSVRQRDAAREVFQMTYGATIVGAIPSFDTFGLEPLLRSQGFCPGWHYRLKCVESLVQGATGREVDGLHEAAKLMCVEQVDAHTALGDARTTRDVYYAVMGREG